MQGCSICHNGTVCLSLACDDQMDILSRCHHLLYGVRCTRGSGSVSMRGSSIVKILLPESGEG